MNNSEYLKHVGAKVRSARKAKGITIRQLSELVSMNYANIGYIELGQRNTTLITLRTIAAALDKEITDFL